MYFTKLIAELRQSTADLARPSFLFLRGNLGVGKTTFTKELLGSYGYPCEQVQSPSFVKLLEYDVKKLGKVVHIDCYRMSELSELQHLDLLQYTEYQLIIIEWPQLFLDTLWSQAEFKNYFSDFSELYIDIENRQLKK